MQRQCRVTPFQPYPRRNPFGGVQVLGACSGRRGCNARRRRHLRRNLTGTRTAQLSRGVVGEGGCTLLRCPRDGVFDKVLHRTPIRSRLQNRRTACIRINWNCRCRLGWEMLACLHSCPSIGVLAAKLAPAWWACICNCCCSTYGDGTRKEVFHVRGGVEYPRAWSWLSQRR